jgi:hypothetical protein
MTEQGPIVSIIAIGEGKSLLFMLPAYCISRGTHCCDYPVVFIAGRFRKTV